MYKIIIFINEYKIGEKMKKQKKTFILAGNPNCGKTTLFNILTKSNEATGNRAGVTVDIKTSDLRKNIVPDVIIADLPGIYSLSPVGNDEKVADKYIKNSKADGIINIADATNLKRSLFLTTELLEKNIPTILVLNMADEVEKEGVIIDKEKLSEKLGVPVVMISAAKNTGIKELCEKIKLLSDGNIPPSKKNFSFSDDKKRTDFINDISKSVFIKNGRSYAFDDKLDSRICRKSVGIPLFFLIMAFIFAFTFSSAGDTFCFLTMKIFSFFISLLEKFMNFAGVGNEVKNFVITVFENGIGSVISLLPRIAMLFALIEVLNDSGYMARAAFVMDAPMRALGLSGKSFIPLITGLGCTVPAVLSTQILEKSERKNVIYSLPFIPCGARFPVFSLITASFFPSHKALAASIIYIFGILMSYISLVLMSKGKKAPPLSIEFPKYRLPKLSNILRAVKSKSMEFISRAGSVIFLCSAAIHILSSLTPEFKFTISADKSILAFIAKKISPVLSPIGLSDYRVCASLISGVFAKEAIVSTLSVLGVNNISEILSLPQGISFTVFVLMYTPCVAALSACRFKLGTKDTAKIALRSLTYAYISAFAVYTFSRIILL